jgi:hypothetical protein
MVGLRARVTLWRRPAVALSAALPCRARSGSAGSWEDGILGGRDPGRTERPGRAGKPDREQPQAGERVRREAPGVPANRVRAGARCAAPRRSGGRRPWTVPAEPEPGATGVGRIRRRHPQVPSIPAGRRTGTAPARGGASAGGTGLGSGGATTGQAGCNRKIASAGDRTGQAAASRPTDRASPCARPRAQASRQHRPTMPQAMMFTLICTHIITE